MVIALAFLLTLLGRRAALVGGADRRHRLRLLHRRARQVHHRRQQLLLQARGGAHLPRLHRPLPRLRAYQRRRGLNEAERVRNAFELIGEARIGPWRGQPRRRRSPCSRSRRRRTRCGAAARPDRRASRRRRTRSRPVAPLDRSDRPPLPGAATETSWFARVVIAVFVVWALASLVAIVGLVPVGSRKAPPGGSARRDRPPQLRQLGARLCSSAVSTALVLVGLARLARGDHLAAYTWFDPGAPGLDLRHPRLHLRRVPVRRRLRARHRHRAAGLGAGDGRPGAPSAGAGAAAGERPSIDSIAAMTTCVVTGGAGFLGSHLCEHLLGEGAPGDLPRQPRDRLAGEHRAHPRRALRVPATSTSPSRSTSRSRSTSSTTWPRRPARSTTCGCRCTR